MRRHSKAPSALQALRHLRCLGILVVFLACGVGSASAATYEPGTPPTFCTAVGGGAGQCKNLKGGVAVDGSNGHVYVLDQGASEGNARIDEYTSAGVFVKAFGVEVVASGQHNTGGFEVCEPSNSVPTDVCQSGITTGTGAVTTALRSLAVDPSTHIVYVGGSTVVKYFNGSTGAFLGEFTATTGLTASAPQAFVQGSGIAIDSSAAQHYIYYAGTVSVIDKFTVPVVTGGVVTTQPGYVCQITGAASAAATECHGTASQDGLFSGVSFTSQVGGDLATDSAGNVFAAETTSRNVVSMFNSTGAWVKAFSVSVPVAVAAGGSGTIFATGGGTATGGTTVKEFKVSNAAEISSFGLPGTSSLGVAVDAGALASNGAIYTSEREGQQLRKFTSAVPPSVTSVSPTTGPEAGGNTVTITGTFLSAASSVKFGAATATITENTATQIKVTAPPGTGTVDIRVTTGNGESANTAADDYVYNSTPVITSITPTRGPLTAGTQVTITGIQLGSATSVKFGATTAIVTENTATQIKVTLPSCSAGTFDIRVVTAGGESPNTAADDYTCAPPPAITSISPARGPLTAGAQVTINGSDLGFATSVKFGAGTATITENTATKIKVTLPSCSAGTFDIRVVTPGGESPNTAADDYTCARVPAITSIDPTVGPVTAGTQVTISGSDLDFATSVKLGAATATVTENTATQIKVTLPSCSAGTFDIRLVTAGGESPNTAADDYTCFLAPTVTTTAGAKQIAQTVATVGGTVNSHGAGVTSCRVEYGTTSAYGREAGCASLPSASTSPVAVSTGLSGLSADTSYHFRFVAASVGGVVNGPDRTFTTRANPCATDDWPCPPPEGTKSCADTPSLCSEPSNVITLRAAKAKDQVLLKAKVPGPGSLVATGKNMVKARGTAKAPGTVVLKLKLTGAGKRALQEQGKLLIKVKVVFTPTGGSPGEATKNVVFESR